ncbi:MAG: hypothetical protein HPZ91_09295 [Lentisphaeria bacterium]|nr:hypothetical protein [Lentisphaeria bacterium]
MKTFNCQALFEHIEHIYGRLRMVGIPQIHKHQGVVIEIHCQQNLSADCADDAVHFDNRKIRMLFTKLFEVIISSVDSAFCIHFVINSFSFARLHAARPGHISPFRLNNSRIYMTADRFPANGKAVFI